MTFNKHFTQLFEEKVVSSLVALVLDSQTLCSESLISFNKSLTFDIRKKNGKNPGVSLKKPPGFGD